MAATGSLAEAAPAAAPSAGGKILKEDVDYTSESEEKQLERFKMELEYLQMFSNPLYQEFLAREGYFNQPASMAYLRYLYNTWKKPEYAKYVRFPSSLAFLRAILEDERYVESLANPAVAREGFNQQQRAWRTRQAATLSFAVAAAEDAAAAAAAEAAPVYRSLPEDM